MKESTNEFWARIYADLEIDLSKVRKKVRRKDYDGERELMALFCRIVSPDPPPPAQPAYVTRQQTVFESIRSNYIFERQHQSMI